jgi:hypothetical protein
MPDVFYISDDPWKNTYGRRLFIKIYFSKHNTSIDVCTLFLRWALWFVGTFSCILFTFCFYIKLYFFTYAIDRLCVLWSEFLATDPEVSGSIPGAVRFSEKQWVWNGVHSALWGQLRSYLEEIVAAPVKNTETNDRGDPLGWPRNTLYQQKLALLRQQAAVAR